MFEIFAFLICPVLIAITAFFAGIETQKEIISEKKEKPEEDFNSSVIASECKDVFGIPYNYSGYDKNKGEEYFNHIMSLLDEMCVE